MPETLELDGTRIDYERRYSLRSRRIRVTLYPGGRVVVTTAKKTTPEEINKFLRLKSKWVLGKLEKMRLLPAHDPKQSRQDYLRHKPAALKLAGERIAHFNRIYGFKHGRVSIKNHRTLWGSCSRQGNLNFSYKIVLIPPHLADYVIVHEICHLGEFNHSARFWALVARTVPDHVRLRRELRKTGLSIN